MSKEKKNKNVEKEERNKEDEVEKVEEQEAQEEQEKEMDEGKKEEDGEDEEKKRGGFTYPEWLVAVRVGLLLVEGNGLLVGSH